MSALHGGPRVFVMADGGTVLENQPVVEALAALAEAESHARIDQMRRDFDAAVENHMARFGFDSETGEFK